MIIFLTFSVWLPSVAWGLGDNIAAQTVGTVYPHILKTETYSLNTRNVKVLTSQGNDLWIGTSKGAIRYDTTTPDSYRVFDNKNSLLSNGIFSIQFDKNDMPWIGTYGGGLSLREGPVWRNINTPHGLCDSFVYDVEFTPKAVWIATWSGANRVTGDPADRKSWKCFTVENTSGGLIDNWVYALEIGKDGRVWFGTESGVSMLDGTKWRSWNHKAGMGAALEHVQTDNRGVMPFFQGDHHTHYGDHGNLSDESFQNFRPNYVLSMTLDKNGNLWIGTWGGGLSLLDTEQYRLRNFTVQDGLPGNYILALKEDSAGNLWIGTNNGLSRFDGATFTNFSKLNGLSSDFIFSIEIGPDRSIWLGGHSGIDRLRRDPVTGTFVRID